MGLTSPTNLSFEFSDSLTLTSPLVSLIEDQVGHYPYESLCDQWLARSSVHYRRRDITARITASSLRSLLLEDLQRSVGLAQERGASNWLISLPIHEHGFSLHKGTFRDALALRYGWLPSHVPSECSCGKSFSVHHALSCAKGGFPIVRHNEIRDLTANLVSEVCHNVYTEPRLQPLDGESLAGATASRDDGARLDVAANGFWDACRERAFYLFNL